MNTDQVDCEKPPAKKRGRKPKSLIAQQNVLTNQINSENKNNLIQNENNIVITMQESANENIHSTHIIGDNMIQNEENDNNKNVIKKRGRKPKGGKIIQQTKPFVSAIQTKPNVILHLKCSLKDLQNNDLTSEIQSFGFESSKNDLSYEIIGQEPVTFTSSQNNNSYSTLTNNIVIPSNASNNFNNVYNSQLNEDEENDNNFDEEDERCAYSEPKEITRKLKILERNLHTNNINDKKSACFWCTHPFDNPPIYIPKCYIKETYHVYGCFCSPECGAAYLLEENIESSTKFERYQLLNNIYCKIYDYNQNIKPAPNPYYMLDKYYGNLSIQEYRSLLKNERLFLIVDKPLTRILPELHEYNDDFILNNKIIPSNAFKVKKKIVSKQNQSKHNILNERFANIQQ
jgi:hypothetical protein